VPSAFIANWGDGVVDGSWNAGFGLGDASKAVACAWQNFAQWGTEGRQDNVYYGAPTYALPLRQNNRGFGQTLQYNAGWSRRAANAQPSYTPFRSTPLTLTLLDAAPPES
jgi:hypothetical protein